MKRSKIQLYVVRQLIAIEEEAAFDVLGGPERPKRTYDSRLSKPGRICSTEFCREFVPGGVEQCAYCGSPR